MTTEEQEVEQVKQCFLSRVNQLFGDIKGWLKEKKELHVEQQNIEIHEKLTGFYMVPTLVITHQTEQLAELKPVGAYIMASEGRVDCLGWLDTEYIIYLVNGGPYLHGKQMFKDVGDDGWYWVENNLKDKAHPMNKETFFKLFAQASDYGL